MPLNKELKPIFQSVLWYSVESLIILMLLHHIYIDNHTVLEDVVVPNVLAYNIVGNEFEPQSRYYVHFRTNALLKGLSPLLVLSSYVK